MLGAGPPSAPGAPGAPKVKSRRPPRPPRPPLCVRLSLVGLLATLAASTNVTGIPVALSTSSAVDVRPTMTSAVTVQSGSTLARNGSTETATVTVSSEAAGGAEGTTPTTAAAATEASTAVPTTTRAPARAGIPAAGAGTPVVRKQPAAPPAAASSAAPSGSAAPPVSSSAPGAAASAHSAAAIEHPVGEGLPTAALLKQDAPVVEKAAVEAADKEAGPSVPTGGSPLTTSPTTPTATLPRSTASTWWSTSPPTAPTTSAPTSSSPAATVVTRTAAPAVASTLSTVVSTAAPVPSSTVAPVVRSTVTPTQAPSSNADPVVRSTATPAPSSIVVPVSSSTAAPAVQSTATPVPSSTPAATTMSLFGLAENLISGFAVMVLQSQVHVDEPGAVETKHEEKATNLLEDLVFKPEPMQFVTPNNTVVVAQRGTTAYLPCVIKNIADGLVTWLRRRDHHLLTVARGGYAQDERFQVVHDQHPEDWTMQLKFVTDRDTGRYECQVSTHPPVSNYIHLKVVEARCVIEGPAEKFVRAGSQLRLSCHIDQGTTEPEFMFWYKDGVMVNYDQHQVYKVTVDLPNNTTTLVVERATRAQSGNYTCEAGQAKPASNYVHVISGENPAAMQTGGGRGGGIAEQPLWLLALLLMAGVRRALG